MTMSTIDKVKNPIYSTLLSLLFCISLFIEIHNLAYHVYQFPA